MAYSGTCGTCSWTLSDAGLLTIAAGTLSLSGGWEDHMSLVKTVNFAGSVSIGTRYGDYMFEGMTNLTTIQNLSRLDTSSAKYLSAMFRNCSSLTSLDLSNFNTANVVSMGNMFYGCSSLKTITFGSNFKTNNVQYMTCMFERCSSLTSLNLSTFNTANVVDMYCMFYNCSSLTSINFGSNFNTAKVKSMWDMFGWCEHLTSLNLSGFSSAVLTNMNGMFKYCTSLSSITFGSNFTTENVTNMHALFSNCSALTSLNLSYWSSAALVNVESMFDSCKALQTITFGSGFTLANATVANAMFYECRALTSLNLSNFNTAKITDFSSFFYNCHVLTSLTLGSNFKGSAAISCQYMFCSCVSLSTLNLTNFNTPNVTEMQHMFNGCEALTSLTFGSGFTTNNVTKMGSMFKDCKALTSLNVSGFNTANVTEMSLMFYGCSSLTSLNMSSFNTVKVTSMSSMFSHSSALESVTLGSGFKGTAVKFCDDLFRDCTSLQTLDLSYFDTPVATLMNEMFRGCESLTSITFGSGFSTANVTNMKNMFRECYSLTNLDVSGFDTTKVLNMQCLFYNCKSLPSLNVSSFNTANVTDMGWLFYHCESLSTLSLGNGFITANVTNMKSMFCGCHALTSLTLGSNFKAESTETLQFFLYECRNLTTLDLSMLTPLAVTDVSHMFKECQSLRTVDLSNFYTPSLVTANEMFYKCKNLRSADLSAMDTTNTTNLQALFSGCTYLGSVDVSSFDTRKCENMENMFYNCQSLTLLDLSNFRYDSALTLRSFLVYANNLMTLYPGDLSTTGNVLTMEFMFYHCLHLPEIPGLENLDTSSVTNMASMFDNCSDLTEIDLSSADTRNVTTMKEMFLKTSSLERITLPDNFVTSALVLPDNVLPDNYFGLCGDETRAIRRVDDGVTITTDADFYQLGLTVGGAAGEWLSGKYTSMTLIITRIPDETDEESCDIRVRTMWDLASTDASSAIIKVYKKLARETDYETNPSYTVGVSGEYGTTDALIEDLTMDAYDFRVELTATDLTIVAYGSVASDFELINISYDGDVRTRGGVTIGPYAIESSQNAITIGYGGPGNRNNSFEMKWDGTAYFKNAVNVTQGGLWVQGGSNAGGNVNRMSLTAGMPDQFPYNTNRRGTFIYSNAIAFADPYNGNSNSDAGWIRHIEETGNQGTFEIGVGDDGNEQVVVRQYNTSSAVVRTATLLDASGNTNFPGTVTMTGALNLANNTWNLVGDDAKFGDCNNAGSFGIQGQNGTTTLMLVARSASDNAARLGFKDASGNRIDFMTLRGVDAYGCSIAMTGGGLTVIGAGESATTARNQLLSTATHPFTAALTDGSEQLILTSDNDITLYTGINSGLSATGGGRFRFTGNSLHVWSPVSVSTNSTNGVTSTVYGEVINIDTNNVWFAAYGARALTDGAIESYIQCRNKKTNGDWVQNNLRCGVKKDGSYYYTITSPSAFCSAIAALPRSGGQMTGRMSFKDGTALPRETGTDFVTVGIRSFSNGGGVCYKGLGDMKTWLGITSSDRRLKHGIENLGDEAVEFIRDLEPSVYWMNGKKQVGFVAQDVADIEPWGTDMACEAPEGRGLEDWEKMVDSTSIWTLDYIRIIPPLVATVQKCLERIDRLEKMLGA